MENIDIKLLNTSEKILIIKPTFGLGNRLEL